MKILVYQCGTKINYQDDILKVIKYFKDKVNLDIVFTAPQVTSVTLQNCPEKLYLPNDNKEQDVLMYIFDRSQRSSSYALNFSKTLQVIEVSTSVVDDGVDYTWKLICHEIMHTFFKRLRNQGIFLDDPMDSMLVNGVKMPYFKNEEPYALDGNFALAFKTLEPHWSKLFPQAGYKYFTAKEIVGLKPELVEKLDKARGLARIPFVITSGYRSVDKNEDVGGVPDSSHTKGEAVDLRARNSTEHFKITKALMDVGFNRISKKYSTHIHVDISVDKPQNVLF